MECFTVCGIIKFALPFLGGFISAWLGFVAARRGEQRRALFVLRGLLSELLYRAQNAKQGILKIELMQWHDDSIADLRRALFNLLPFFREDHAKKAQKAWDEYEKEDLWTKAAESADGFREQVGATQKQQGHPAENEGEKTRTAFVRILTRLDCVVSETHWFLEKWWW